MVGMWDGVPASPCSGASDEAPYSTTHPRQSKRGRRMRRNTYEDGGIYATTTSYYNSTSSSEVEFVGATGHNEGKTASNSQLAAKLNSNTNNNTADDERRKALLAQLRLIDRRKATLRNIANGKCQLPPSNEPVIEVATPEPNDPPNLVLDISAVKSIGRPVDTAGFCSSPPPARTTSKPKNNAKYSRPKSKASSPSLSYADLANPTRRTSSRRATRPRTPSVLLNGMPGETVLRSLPVGVLKCKRYSYCKKVISLLFKAPSAGPFTAPVKELWKPEAVPRYFDVITRPMDLGTIKKNMEDTTYLNMEESDPLRMFNPRAFAEDVRQVFRNAQIYNKEGDVLHNCAGDLLKEFEAMWESLPESTSRADNRRKRQSTALANRLPTSAKRGRIEPQPIRPRFTMKPTHLKGKKTVKSPVGASGSGTFKIDEEMTTRQMKKRVEYLKKCRLALRARTVLPKGASFYDRAAIIADVPFSDAEKNEIAKAIKKLPATKLNNVLQIIGHGQDNNDDYEEEDIELDVFSMDTKTLRNIEAFLEQAVTGFKTLRNSNIGQEFSSPDEFHAELVALEKRLLESPKNRVDKKKNANLGNEDGSNNSQPGRSFSTLPDPAAQLYASSDEDSDDSDSDSGSDSDSE